VIKSSCQPLLNEFLNEVICYSKRGSLVSGFEIKLLYNPSFQGIADQFGSVANVGFAKHVGPVLVHGEFADA
jgi:hypothetical protein